VDLTIIIVNWNGGDMLLRCLESIRKARAWFGVKVIVVDNNSKDGSRECAAQRFPEYDVFNSGSNLGFGRANNLAKSRVTTPLVLFLNPDTELMPDTLENAVSEMQKHADVGALGCKMFYPGGQVQEQGLQWSPSPLTALLELLFVTEGTSRRFKRWMPTFDPNQSGYVNKLYGGFILIRRDLLDEIGWFDDRYFMYAEDVDMCLAVRERGWKLYYASNVEIMHVAGGVSKNAPSGFSILMKSESVSKLMRKRHGRFGSAAYRLAILLGATTRMIVLSVLYLVSLISRAKPVADFGGSFFKHRMLILWSLGMRRATPAQ
jgi:GT2 family glycosyltransferase